MTSTIPQTGPTDQKILAEFLKTRHEYCPACKYDLHQLESDHCPECGEPLALHVGLSSPYQAAWIVVTIVLFAQVWLASAIWYQLIRALSHYHRLGYLSPVELYVIYYLSATVPATAIWLKMRRRFLRLKRQKQHLIMAGVIVAALPIAYVIIVMFAKMFL